jgi:hypothetical protein
MKYLIFLHLIIYQVSASIVYEKNVWGGSYWPLFKGGLSYSQIGFKTLSELFENKDLLNKISPIQKWDIIQGDLKFSLTRRERKKQVPLFYYWWGYCDGLSVAALFESHPKSKRFKTLLGDIFLSEEEIKGLMAYFYTNTYEVAQMWGSREKNITANEFHHLLLHINRYQNLIITYKPHSIDNYPISKIEMIEYKRDHFKVSIYMPARKSSKHFKKTYFYKLDENNQYRWTRKSPKFIWIPKKIKIIHSQLSTK